MNSMTLKALLTALTALLMAATASAQDVNDSTTFKGYLYNSEYEVFIRMDLYKQNITVPGQELYGELPGYLQREKTSFCWLITAATIDDARNAHLEMVNDYGSEDLVAQLTFEGDSIYTLRQLEGSTIKVPRNGKWQRLPKVLRLKLNALTRP